MHDTKIFAEYNKNRPTVLLLSILYYNQNKVKQMKKTTSFPVTTNLFRNTSSDFDSFCILTVICDHVKKITLNIFYLSYGKPRTTITVPYRHGGGWSKKINAWYLNTLMVYL